MEEKGAELFPAQAVQDALAAPGFGRAAGSVAAGKWSPVWCDAGTQCWRRGGWNSGALCPADPRCFVKAGGNAPLVPRKRGQASICRGDGCLDPFSVPGLGSRLVPALLWRGVVMEGVCVHPRVPVISSAKLALGRGVRQGHLPAVRIWGLGD